VIRAGCKTLLLTTLIALMLVGCRHEPPLPDHGPLRKIGLMPIGTPREFEVANANFFARLSGLGTLAMSMENRRKSQEFADRMRAEQMEMGDELTKLILEELPKQGYEVALIDRAPGKGNDPDDIDYGQIHTDGAVLHVWIQDIGMDSPMLHNDYLPRLTVAVTLIYPSDGRPLYDEWLYYGVEAKKSKNWSVPGEPRYRFGNYEQMLNNPDQVIAVFDDGLRATAQHIGREFRRAVK
jgi:hypothetical protein